MRMSRVVRIVLGVLLGLIAIVVVGLMLLVGVVCDGDGFSCGG